MRHNFEKAVASAALVVSMVIAVSAISQAGTIYLDGTADSCPGCTFGDHLVFPQAFPSVGSGGISNNGDALNGARTFIFDNSAGSAAAIAAGVTTRGDANFSMLIWDMGSPFDTMRMYTHQDHYNGGPITTNFVAQDVMEYSVWGSNDGNTFELLSDVTAFDITGGGAGKPTYTFTGTEPSFVFRDGSDAFGAVNAYTRDYTFPNAFRYYGAKTSTISLNASDADPEIDAMAANAGPIVTAPEFSGTLYGMQNFGWIFSLGGGLLGLAVIRQRHSRG